MIFKVKSMKYPLINLNYGLHFRLYITALAFGFVSLKFATKLTYQKLK